MNYIKFYEGKTLDELKQLKTITEERLTAINAAILSKGEKRDGQ